jgi:hypothetical protein
LGVVEHLDVASSRPKSRLDPPKGGNSTARVSRYIMRAHIVRAWMSSVSLWTNGARHRGSPANLEARARRRNGLPCDTLLEPD